MTARTQHLLAQRTGFVLEHRHRNTSQIPDLSKKSQDINCCPKASPENFNSLQESSEVRETSAAKEDMRSLLALLIVTLALAALCCCEKGKGTSSQEGSQSAAEPCSLLPASLQSGRDTELWVKWLSQGLQTPFIATAADLQTVPCAKTAFFTPKKRLIEICYSTHSHCLPLLFSCLLSAQFPFPAPPPGCWSGLCVQP